MTDVKGNREDMATQSRWGAPAAEKTQDGGVSGLVGKVTDKAKEIAGAAVEKAQDFGETVSNLIRRYPLPALLVGFGVGFLLAKVLRGRGA
jgi:hypothetical protein